MKINLTFFYNAINILSGLNNASLISRYIFQKTVECKLPMLRLCHLQPLDYVIEILSHRMNGYI